MSEDVVDHPSHYAEGWSNGAEVIDITENLNFNRGNAVKYISRAGRKNQEKELEDLQKAEFYLKREIKRISQRWDNPPTYQVVSWPRVWGSLYDVPSDVKAVTAANGCRWRYYDNEVPEGSPGGFPVTGWYWSSAHAREHGYSYSSAGPFTEVLARPDQEEDTQ